mmetsp:Transcript_19411/g.49761  ORF Transcript_19411/g.49761 Transcript_19411/m.49761 type:complete len:249 (-) Transcript_19411:73-819(-)
MASSSSKVSSTPIWFFVPNLIGYARIILAVVAFIYYRSPYIFITSYAVSYLLDALDGTMARLLNQGSRFGAVLDMITDRASTLGLYIVLGHLYYKHMAWFACLAGLDLCSHFTQMYQSLVSGSNSHKKIEKSRSWLLQLYYHDRRVLFIICFFQELYLLALYALHHFAKGREPLFHLSLPWKSSIEHALFTLGIPSELGFTPLHVVAAVAFIPFVTKQVINLIQWLGAAEELAKLDAEERAQKSAKKD